VDPAKRNLGFLFLGFGPGEEPSSERLSKALAQPEYFRALYQEVVKYLASPVALDRTIVALSEQVPRKGTPSGGAASAILGSQRAPAVNKTEPLVLEALQYIIGKHRKDVKYMDLRYDPDEKRFIGR
jgi:hypothetical protein